MKFTYRSGQRPLEGYTLKRGVGQGGFGEVYFAVSDGGKEVALKLLKGPTEIELRGVANCLNLKHPNLVHVYDLKQDERGDAWLVMEYVLGESLAQVIERHPSGLPHNLAKEWFLNLSRAVGFLHDHGVVHRDLKPANIFIENGTLKVGDYGLCKALGASNRQQTRTIGTVHYMAPEVSSGNYNRQIDVYSCGVILYEMLTGDVPFDGESDGEILMKHLTAAPDLGRVPEAFRGILAKALDKNPVKRFATMVEFARAVEQGMGSTAPPLSTAAGSVVAATVLPASVVPFPGSTIQTAIPIPSVAEAPPVVASQAVKLEPAATALPVASPATIVAVFRDRLAELTGAMVKAPLLAGLLMIPYAVISRTTDWTELGQVLALAIGLSWGILVGSLGMRYRMPDSWAKRLRLGLAGMLAGSGAYWISGWDLPTLASPGSNPDDRFFFGLLNLSPDAASAALHYLLYFGGVLTAGRWWRATAKDRKERFSLMPLIAAGFWSGILLFLWPWVSGSPVPGGIAPLVVAAIVVQLSSPWSPPSPQTQAKKLRYRPA